LSPQASFSKPQKKTKKTKASSIMGNQRSTCDYLVPRCSKDHQRLVNEALARNQSTRQFLSSGLVLQHIRGEELWETICKEPPHKRAERALAEMGRFADVVTVVFTDWSATETDVYCSFPVSDVFLKQVTSTQIANWVYLIEHASNLNQQIAIQDLLRHVCERV